MSGNVQFPLRRVEMDTRDNNRIAKIELGHVSLTQFFGVKPKK